MPPLIRFIRKDPAGVTPAAETETGEKTIICELCPHHCGIRPGSCGICKTRFNSGGKSLPFYGFITALAADPIEKKPLYHFRPGSRILSVGFAGCNMRCPFCQNWQISQRTDTGGRFITIRELVRLAAGCGQIAFTYSEPLVHIEFLLDCMRETRKAGIANVLVTNGCVNSGAAGEVLDLTDAANIDLKSFSEETYSKVLGGDLGAVLDFIKTACAKNVHTEITTLVVPGLNDSAEELDACADFIAGLDCGYGKSIVPWHLSAYHPDWKWNVPAAPPEHITGMAARAGKKLPYVYTGNFYGGKSDTVCGNCGKIIIGRNGYHTNASGLSEKNTNEKNVYCCARCGNELPIRNILK